MILVDTSVWIDHLRTGDKMLSSLLESGQVLSHPFVIGELALGNLRQRNAVLKLIKELPPATVAFDHEALELIERHQLAGLGIGYIDVHLIAATRLTAGATLWTRDKRLAQVAGRAGVAFAGLPTVSGNDPLPRLPHDR